MVAKLHVLKDLDNLSRRSSTYVAIECEKFFELPTFNFEHFEETTTCFSILKGKKTTLKTFSDIQALLTQEKKRDVKLAIRENSWPINSVVPSRLWPALCSQHQVGKSMLDGFYWDMVNQVFGTTELPEKPIMLPPFVDSTHCLPYHLTRKGRSVADRVVTVLAYTCPDITYSPSLYPITALLLHFMSEEECYHCLASLVAAKEKVFITQTKLLYEVTWKTVMQIAKKHAKSAVLHLQRICPGQKSEKNFMDWSWWILGGLPLPHLVRVMDCYFHEGIKVFYRISLAILILFHKNATSLSSDSEWNSENLKNDIENALPKFCRNIPVSPTKLLRTAFNIRALSSTYISRVFIKTEMVLKSRSVLSGSKQLVRSRCSDNLPTSQSQVNIQMMSHTLTIREEIYAAQSRLRGIAVRTPLLKFNFEITGIDVYYLKCEQFQPISSFKIRDAANAFQILSIEDKKNGVATASAGNMAQGVAWIARKENISCQVLVPDTANEAKLQAIKRLGGKITTCSFEQWWQVLITHQCPMLDGYFIHPVCDRNVIAGHGTIALEILEDLPDCDAILVPYGGGALITGIASVAKHMKPSIDVFACEIETAAPLAAAFNNNEVTEIPMRKSWVDGILSSSVLKEMWPLVKTCVDNSIVVTLNETAKALKILIERNHFLCEGASATTIAAALWHYKNYVDNGKAGLRRNDSTEQLKVVAVLSGAGIDNEKIIKCLEETL